MLCDVVRKALASLPACEETDEGMRFATHCLYPSFEPVSVYVVGFGDGYKVHDGGGAVRAAWDHARDLALIRKMLNRQAAAFGITVTDDSLVAEAVGAEWLVPAILSVANASATAAHTAIERVASANESVLRERIFATLTKAAPVASIAKEYAVPGKSGKVHHFDFAVHRPRDGWLLVNAVAPHHVSVSAKYVAFSDTRNGHDEIAGRFAVHDRPLEQSDAALLQQVADLVPFAALEAGVRREMVPRA